MKTKMALESQQPHITQVRETVDKIERDMFLMLEQLQDDITGISSKIDNLKSMLI